MILPDKYINYQKSYIGISNEIVGIALAMKKKFYVEEIWKKFKTKNEKITFSKFYNAYLLLLLFEIITINKEGECSCNIK